MVNDVRLLANQPPVGFINPVVGFRPDLCVRQLTLDNSYTQGSMR